MEQFNARIREGRQADVKRRLSPPHRRTDPGFQKSLGIHVSPSSNGEGPGGTGEGAFQDTFPTKNS